MLGALSSDSATEMSSNLCGLTQQVKGKQDPGVLTPGSAGSSSRHPEKALHRLLIPRVLKFLGMRGNLANKAAPATGEEHEEKIRC